MKHTVYAIYCDRFSSPLYVGRTSHPVSLRLSMHISSGASERWTACDTHGPTRKLKAVVMDKAKRGEISLSATPIMQFGSKKKAAMFEAQEIIRLQPPLNTMGNPRYTVAMQLLDALDAD